ncbi:SprT-like domain-containing protein [Paenibacillus sp. 1P03SA]|uniref:SprT-like domain-containing protein n=1 Tax=Paenibacillus sp. 1P03SA TaxID=3132294 RepID=UPI0039A2DCCC
MNIQMATDELHVAFRRLNKAFFDSELPEPAITIQSGGKRSTMGWCTLKPIWRDKEKTIQMYEINIAAEYLNIDFYETMDTLLHEMIHLYCRIHNIKETSRKGQYHNKRFKEESLKRGFYYPENKPDKRIGWSYSKITEETKKLIDTFNINTEVFQIARGTFVSNQTEGPEGEREEQQKSHNRKYICPVCSQSVRATKEVNIICGDCMETMEVEIQ